MSGKKAHSIMLMDDRVTDQDEQSTLIDVDTAAELGTYLHGVYKISKTLANAYALVVMTGARLTIRVGATHYISLWDSMDVTTGHELRHPHVLHPSGKTYMQRLEEEADEREALAYAAMLKRRRERDRGTA